jgi:hypothetical protein
MIAKMDAWLEEIKVSRREMTEACLESKEPTSLETESIAVHEEIPKEEAVVKTVRELRNRHGDWHLAVRWRGLPKKWTQSNGSSWKKLAAAHSGMTRHATPAL